VIGLEQCSRSVTIKGKGKHGRKRKSAALEADKLEPELIEPEVARIIEAPKLWRALVARMI
jgi:hypothetical protein